MKVSAVGIFSILLFTSLYHSQVEAAACCGGGASFPTLITGDFRSQISMSSTYGRVIGDVTPAGESVFRRDTNREDTRTLKVDGSYQFADLWQAGLSLPVLQKDRSLSNQQSSASGVGDVSFSAAFEFLPEYTYTEWKPRGFVYTRLTFPTARSIYDSQEVLATDARGAGFYSQAIGALFTKTRGAWDFQGGLEMGKGWTREFTSPAGSLTITPGTTVALMLAAGFSPPKISEWRFGGGISPRYTGVKTISGASNTSSVEEWVWDTTLTVNYLIQKEWMAGLTYLDQTLFGPAQNTSLSRSLSIMLQKRWSL